MRQILTIVLLFASVFAFGQEVPKEIVPYLPELDRGVKMDKVVVGFYKNVDPVVAEEWLADLGLSKVWYLEEKNMFSVRLATPAKNYIELRALLEKLEENRSVIYASPVLETTDHLGYAVRNKLYVKVGQSNDLNTFNFISGEVRKLAYGQREELSCYGTNEPIHYSYTEYPTLPGTYIFYLNKNSRLNTLEMSIVLHALPETDFAEPDYVLNPIVATNDQYYNRQWSHVNDSSTFFAANYNAITDADMDVDSAWTITKGSNTIRIAVIDSGVDTLHSDLKNNLVGGYDAIGNGTFGYPNFSKKSNAHGTACAGIIAAEDDNGIGIAGVAPDCAIIPIRVFYYIDTNLNGAVLNDIPFSTSQWFTDAITWGWQTGSADIMSNSWGLNPIFLAILPGNPAMVDSIIDLAVQYGRDGKGTIMVFSSGNENTRPIWPSKKANTLAINATSMCDEAKFDGSCDGESWTGCWGQDLDVSAPGVKITTCDLRGSAGYTNGDYTFTFNGTSAACPHAAGVLALMLSVRPDLTFTQARWILGRSADKVGGYSYNTGKFAGTWSNELGYGRINAYSAVKMSQSFVEVTDLTSINDLQTDNKLTVSVFPNPVSGNEVMLSVNIPTQSNAVISVYALSGQLVYQLNQPNLYGTQQIKLQLPNVEAGMYFVQVQAANYIGVTKLCVAAE